MTKVKEANALLSLPTPSSFSQQRSNPMHITYSHGHVNDLANIKAKDEAITEALNWLRHWQEDVASGIAPTVDSLRMVEAKLNHAAQGLGR